MTRPSARSRRLVTTALGSSGVYTLLGVVADGATLVVISGQHGDELASQIAAGILAAHGLVMVGTIVVVPQANPSACELTSRYGWGSGETDLNRAWGRASSHCAHAAHAAAVWAEVRPDLHVTLDLHEHLSRTDTCWAYTSPSCEWSSATTQAVGLATEAIPEGTRHALAVEAPRCLTVETGVVGWTLRERVMRHLWIVLSVAASLGIEVRLSTAWVDRSVGAAP